MDKHHIFACHWIMSLGLAGCSTAEKEMLRGELPIDTAKRRCAEIYGPEYCLVRFEEKGPNRYWAICGLKEEGKCL